jgi:hypothetical protein
MDETGLAGLPVEAQLNTLMGRPAYFFRTETSRWHVVYTDNGSVMRTVSPELATESASRYMGKTIDVAKIQFYVASCQGPDRMSGVRYRSSDGSVALQGSCLLSMLDLSDPVPAGAGRCAWTSPHHPVVPGRYRGCITGSHAGVSTH